MSISKKLNITSAGVGKIRDKLERKGIIKGYDVKVDHDQLGLGTFAVLHVRVTPEGWKYRGSMGVQDLIASNPNIVALYRVPGRNVTHIMICTFRDIKELDTFLHVIQAQLSDYIEIVESYTFSCDSIIKNSFSDLLVKMIDEGDDKRMPEPVLFGHILGDED